MRPLEGAQVISREAIITLCLTSDNALLTVQEEGNRRGCDVSTIDRMLRREEVQERTGLSRSAIYRLMREGDFPLPHRVGQRAVRWRESDLEAWLASRPLATGRKAAA